MHTDLLTKVWQCRCGVCRMADVVAYLGWMLALPETLYIFGLLASFVFCFYLFFIVGI